ncbi:hypothetical protein EOA30_03845 [Mesorhizobium sp. M8A.F.Ca.ET.059.01.1.1]|nr:hypothetical protein EOA30_03845 [Mesorhizobium sp. M8A.F.Ca.ET.059.01.1.1]
MDTSPTMLIGRHATKPAINLFAIFVAMYFSELTSFRLSIDEETTALRTDPSVWVAQGRWGAYLIEKFVFPHPIMPFLMPAIFGAACVAAYLLIMDRIGKRVFSIAEYASFVIFCSFPSWFFIVEFYSNIGAVGVGLFSMTLALWLIGKTEAPVLGPRFLCAIAAGCFALSIYQSFAPAILVLGIAIAVLRARTGADDSFAQDVLRTGILLIGSVLFYFIGDSLFRYFITLRNEYFDSLFQPGFLLQHPIAVMGRTLGEMGSVYGMDYETYSAALWTIPLLIVLGGVTLFMGAPRIRLQLTAAAIVLLLIPFAFHLLAVGDMPTRSLVGVPLAMWLFVYLAVTGKNPVIRASSGVLLAVAVFQILVIQNYRQASNYLVDKHDTLLAASIYDRLSDTPGFDAKRTYAVSVFGSRPFETVYPRPPNSTVGHSFFEWDGGNPRRIASYMSLLGYSNLKSPTRDQLDQTISQLLTMPVWPAPGSIAIKDDIALIKLGDMPSGSNQASLARLAARQK